MLIARGNMVHIAGASKVAHGTQHGINLKVDRHALALCKAMALHVCFLQLWHVYAHENVFGKLVCICMPVYACELWFLCFLKLKQLFYGRAWANVPLFYMYWFPPIHATFLGRESDGQNGRRVIRFSTTLIRDPSCSLMWVYSKNKSAWPCVGVEKCMCMCALMCACVYVCVHACVCAYVHACMLTCKCVHMCMSACPHVYL